LSDINAGSEHVDGTDQQPSDQEKGQTRNMITSNVVEPEAKKTNKTFPILPGELERDLVQVFKLLSDETRLRILLYLAQERELHVTALCDKLGQSQPAVSHHLALLRVAGLIEARRDGKHNFYSVRKIHFHRIIGELFANISDPDNEVRFDDYVLTQN
jgi:ArsR family transcriptional regulator, arsenate/arsenite/antimonite-responsive transcriptional repressor